MRRLSVFFFLGLALSGCLSTTSSEELGRLTKSDPAFQKMIESRDQTRSQIRLLKQDMLQKKKVMDQDVEKLRHGYDVYARSQSLKIEQYQAAIDANRNALARELETDSARLKAKMTEQEGYRKTLREIHNVLREGKGIQLSPQEKEKWEERALLLSEKIRPLEDEIQELKAQIQLKKKKSAYLR